MKKVVRYIRELPVVIMLLAAKVSIQFLPRCAVLLLARLLGWLSYSFSAKRRRLAAANLDLVYGDTLASREKRRINIASFQNMALVLLDLYWFNYRTAERMKRYFVYDKSFESIFDGRPNIIVTAHFGNWEVVSLACGQRGLPLTSVALKTKSTVGEKVLTELRKKSGSEIVQRNGAVRKIIRSLRRGRSTAFLLDHNTLPEEGGVFVPFFGLAVPVADVIKVLVQRTDARIVVAYCMPDAAGVYTVKAFPPLATGEGGIAYDDLTAYMTGLIEKFIRENPHCWLWCYKRWRYFRRQDPAERYPFYAESYEAYREYAELIQRYRKAPPGTEKDKLLAKLAAASRERRRRLREREQQTDSRADFA